MVESTWANRDLPVLQAIVEFFDDPDQYQLRIPELARLCGFSEPDIQRALRALDSASPPYLEATTTPAGLTYPIIITAHIGRFAA